MTGPTSPLVLTGATGFIGRRLLAALVTQSSSLHSGRTVTILARRPGDLDPLPTGWRAVEWDLAGGAEPPAGSIPPGSVVIHLGAATGAASAEEMRATIVEGTGHLARAARTAGASHFILVSSIAAGFRNRRWYPYAEAKRAAEAIVSGSGTPATVVRPTMVFGAGSPVQAGLERLALAAVPVVPGSGRVQVEPVAVEDLVTLLLALAEVGPGGGEVLDVGGGERVTMRELLAMMRASRRLSARAALPIPLGLPRLLLAGVERLPGVRFPVTAGQFASFLNDSIATPDPRVERLLPVRMPLATMLATPANGLDASSPGPPMDQRDLAHEFVGYARYLGSPHPGRAATEAYLRCHASAAATDDPDPLDRRLVRLAGRSLLGCRLADHYARRARPHGALRRRLVLALAVLESSPATHGEYDTALPAPPAATWVAVGLRGLAWLGWTALAVALIGPVHLLDRWNGKAPERARG